MNRFGNQRGFTLIEILIVLGLMGIISALAIPIYSRYKQQSFRGNAKAVLMEEAGLMERYQTQNNTYEDAELSKKSISGGTYIIKFANANADDSNADSTTFTIEAVPSGSQAGDSCGTLSIDNMGRKVPPDCW